MAGRRVETPRLFSEGEIHAKVNAFLCPYLDRLWQAQLPWAVTARAQHEEHIQIL
jgi:hypothetical protein